GHQPLCLGDLRVVLHPDPAVRDPPAAGPGFVDGDRVRFEECAHVGGFVFEDVAQVEQRFGHAPFYRPASPRTWQPATIRPGRIARIPPRGPCHPCVRAARRCPRPAAVPAALLRHRTPTPGCDPRAWNGTAPCPRATASWPVRNRT